MITNTSPLTRRLLTIILVFLTILLIGHELELHIDNDEELTR